MPSRRSSDFLPRARDSFTAFTGSSQKAVGLCVGGGGAGGVSLVPAASMVSPHSGWVSACGDTPDLAAGCVTVIIDLTATRTRTGSSRLLAVVKGGSRPELAHLVSSPGVGVLHRPLPTTQHQRVQTPHPLTPVKSPFTQRADTPPANEQQ